MGNNAAYRDFEEVTIGLYNIGRLDLPALDVLGKCFYSYPDIDSGGSQDLLTNDGKDLCQVVVELLDPAFAPSDDREWWEAFDDLVEARYRSTHDSDQDRQSLMEYTDVDFGDADSDNKE